MLNIAYLKMSFISMDKLVAYNSYNKFNLNNNLACVYKMLLNLCKSINNNI